MWDEPPDSVDSGQTPQHRTDYAPVLGFPVAVAALFAFQLLADASCVHPLPFLPAVVSPAVAAVSGRLIEGFEFVDASAGPWRDSYT